MRVLVQAFQQVSRQARLHLYLAPRPRHERAALSRRAVASRKRTARARDRREHTRGLRDVADAQDRLQALLFGRGGGESRFEATDDARVRGEQRGDDDGDDGALAVDRHDDDDDDDDGDDDARGALCGARARARRRLRARGARRRRVSSSATARELTSAIINIT